MPTLTATALEWSHVKFATEILLAQEHDVPVSVLLKTAHDQLRELSTLVSFAVLNPDQSFAFQDDIPEDGDIVLSAGVELPARLSCWVVEWKRDGNRQRPSRLAMRSRPCQWLLASRFVFDRLDDPEPWFRQQAAHRREEDVDSFSAPPLQTYVDELRRTTDLAQTRRILSSLGHDWRRL